MRALRRVSVPSRVSVTATLTAKGYVRALRRLSSPTRVDLAVGLPRWYPARWRRTLKP